MRVLGDFHNSMKVGVKACTITMAGNKKSGTGVGKIDQIQKKGPTIIWPTPRYIWLPSADSNHGPDG
jgi:hypothetical protein